MNRKEHLEWAKKRALEYVDAGELENAFTSLASDLGKHPDTAGHIGIDLGMRLLMGGHLSTAQQMREHINGYN